MAKFRKKPIVIEAMRFAGFGNLSAELEDFLMCTWNRKEDGCLYIQTLEGEMKADIGAWIIRGVSGEFYPCKPHVFEATYESLYTNRFSRLFKVVTNVGKHRAM